MVGPSVSDDERRTLSARLRVGFVLLVGASGGLVALQAGAGPVAILLGAAGGTVVGLALVVYLSRIAPWDATGSREE